MKPLRLTLAAMAFAACAAGCDATRLTAPPAGASLPAAANPTPPAHPNADQIFGSGG